MTVAIIVTVAGSAAIGFVIARAFAVLVPIVALAIFYAGLNAEVWGNGVGDGWEYAMAILMAVGVAGAVLGVVVRARAA